MCVSKWEGCSNDRGRHFSVFPASISLSPPSASKTNGAFPPVPHHPATLFTLRSTGARTDTQTHVHTQLDQTAHYILTLNEYNKELITTGVVWGWRNTVSSFFDLSRNHRYHWRPPFLYMFCTCSCLCVVKNALIIKFIISGVSCVIGSDLERANLFKGIDILGNIICFLWEIQMRRSLPLSRLFSIRLQITEG